MDKPNPQVIIIIICIVVISAILYYLHITRLRSSECAFMNNIYGTLNTRIKPINASSAQCQFNLQDYYIKTAYNCCSGGSYKNDYVDTCNLINVLKQGCRGLDFEIYSIDDNPVVSTSVLDNNYVKETYNYIEFSEVMNILTTNAFSASTAPNYTDPLIIHLRIKSNNSKMFANFADLFKQYSGFMLGETYSYENHGQNIGNVPLLTFMTSSTSSKNNIILIVDRENKTFLENNQFMEYVNMTSNSIFMRALRYYDIKHAQDSDELKNFNKKNLSIGMPDIGVNPKNPNGIVVRESGCQMIAMRYQYVDSNNYLEENIGFFDKAGFAFALKPDNLRYIPVELPDPTPQRPELSYESRNVSSDYFSFSI